MRAHPADLAPAAVVHAGEAPDLERWWELSDDLLCVIGPEGLMRAVNPAWRRMLSWPADELVGRSPLDLIHPEDLAGSLPAMRAEAPSGRIGATELRCRHADGSYHWLLWSAHRESDLWYAMAKDVSTRKAAECELADRDSRSRALVGALRDGLCVVGLDARISEVSDRLCEITGFSREELVGAAAPFPFWPEEDAERIQASFARTLEGGSGHREWTFKRRNGERFPASLDISTLTHPDTGEAQGMIAVIRDVSQEVAEREDLREAHRVARLASWTWDPVRDRLEVSTSLLTLAGVELWSIRSLAQAMDIIPAPYDERVRDMFERVAAGEDDEATLEYRVNLPNEEIAWVETRAQSVRDATGEVVAVRGTSQDITVRKVAELAHRESEERLRQAQRVAHVGSFEVDHRTHRVSWSPELYRLFGLHEQRPPRLDSNFAMVPEGERERLARLWEATLEDGRPREFEHRFLRGDDVRFAETRMEAMTEDGKPYGVRGTLQDITERKRAEWQIQLQGHLLDAVDVAVIATELDGAITNWNGGAERAYGWSRAEAVGRPISELVAGPSGQAGVQAIATDTLRRGHWQGELQVRRKDGVSFPAFVRQTVLAGPDGEPAGIVGVSVDISERVESERQLEAARNYMLAVTDSIGEGVCTVDLDGRLIYLNRAGEEMLGFRKDELIGRVMHDVTHYRHADGTPHSREDCPLSRARRNGVVARVDDDVFIRKDGSALPVEYTTAPFETEDGVQGSVVVFSDISERKAEEERVRKQMETVTWVGRIRDALTEDRFVLHAQPIVDLSTGETVQHELLIRMVDSNGSLVPPALFLPAAEEYGLIVDIDRWVVRQAIDLAADGHPVELNLSASSIAAPSLLEDFRRALERTGAEPSLIAVELTETVLLEDEEAASRFISSIAELGCGLALDDFGTGYGGFTYLKRLPVDYLKIDTEFVTDLPTNEASQHVVKAVVNLARGFGQETVAEGVEDEATLRMLRELGVDFAQGYAIARPGPLVDVLGAATPA
jgi:PAS domain S-box-containing protein